MALDIATSPLAGGDRRRMPASYTRTSPITHSPRRYHARVAPLVKQIKANAVAGRIVVWFTEPCLIHHGTHMPVFRIIPATLEAYLEYCEWANNLHLVLNPQREDFESAVDCTCLPLSIDIVGYSRAPKEFRERVRALNPWAFSR